MTCGVSRTAVAAALLAGACLAQPLEVKLADRQLVRDRLASGAVLLRERQAKIEDLFHDAGCPVEEQRPILKQNISDYLTTVREDLLKGIESVIDNLERDVVPAWKMTPTTARP